MPRGSKSKYTSKQKRRASKIESSYKRRGVKSGEAARRAWATVNKEEGGGKKSGSGRGRKPDRTPRSVRSHRRRSVAREARYRTSRGGAAAIRAT